jgi:serine/threonine protein kinase
MPADSGSLVGSLVGGIYRVRRLIGQGGMGEVYSADSKAGDKVALKVLHDKADQDPDLVARFQRYLSFAEVAPVVYDALQGLEAAHAAGVVHRDIKPANLYIEKRTLTDKQIDAEEPEERTRILDFGVSKFRPRGNKSEPSLTAFDATLGSFAYMAPEQVRGSARWRSARSRGGCRSRGRTRSPSSRSSSIASRPPWRRRRGTRGPRPSSASSGG